MHYYLCDYINVTYRVVNLCHPYNLSVISLIWNFKVNDRFSLCAISNIIAPPLARLGKRELHQPFVNMSMGTSESQWRRPDGKKIVITIWVIGKVSVYWKNLNEITKIIWLLTAAFPANRHSIETRLGTEVNSSFNRKFWNGVTITADVRLCSTMLPRFLDILQGNELNLKLRLRLWIIWKCFGGISLPSKALKRLKMQTNFRDEEVIPWGEKV